MKNNMRGIGIGVVTVLPLLFGVACGGTSKADDPNESIGNAGQGGEAPVAETESGDSATPIAGSIDRSGYPVAGVTVVVDGVEAVTDEKGAFSFDSVAKEYDLLVLDHGSIHIYQGLTTRSPRLASQHNADSSTENEHGALISGALSGGAGVPAPDHRAVVAFTASSPYSTSSAVFFDDSSAYSLITRWSGAAQVTGELFGLQWAVADGNPSEFTGFVRKTLTLDDDDNQQTDLVLTTDPGETRIDGKLTLPSGAGEITAMLELALAPTVGAVPLVIHEGEFSVVAPDIDMQASLFVNARLGTKGEAGYSSASVPRPKTGAWQVTLPDAPTLVHEDGSSTFAWTGMPAHSVASAYFRLGESWVTISTTRSSIRLPDLSKYGVSNATDASTEWGVFGLGPANNTDELLELNAAMNSKPADVAYWQVRSGY